MARNQADILQLQIGSLVLQLSQALSQVEVLQEEAAKLRAELEAHNGVREPDKKPFTGDKVVSEPAPHLQALKEIKKNG
jgi:hypothetical protein